RARPDRDRADRSRRTLAGSVPRHPAGNHRAAAFRTRRDLDGAVRRRAAHRLHDSRARRRAARAAQRSVPAREPRASHDMIRLTRHVVLWLALTTGLAILVYRAPAADTELPNRMPEAAPYVTAEAHSFSPPFE